MAKRLLGAGFAVTVHNRTRAKAEGLVAAGAKWADTAREAAADADAIITMVADDAASRALWLGHAGALADAKVGVLGLDCSTVSPAWSDELTTAAKAAGVRFLDAPVTGSRPQAAAGELIFMVGGDAETLERARPLLNAMGKKIVHAGGAGAGCRVKLINNFMAGVQAATLVEALRWMQRDGVDPAAAMEVILNGAPGSPMVNSIYKRASTGDTEKYFHLNLMAKDLLYAQEAAAKVGVPLRTAAAAVTYFQGAIERGDGDKDVSAVVRCDGGGGRRRE